MPELRDVLKQFAERGTHVGPDVVYRRAVRAASSRGARRQASDGIRRRTALRVATVALVGAAVLVGAVALWPSPTTDRRRVTAGPTRPGGDTPRRGGDLVFGIEDEMTSWCLPRGQLTPSAIEVANALYDSLTVPARGADGTIRYVPYLARSVDHDRTYTTWTITLRPGVTFHDGEPLTAAAVKQNLDAYRAGPLFGLVLDDVTRVDVIDGSTVRVRTAVPWVAFDAFLWSNGRLGILAPKQLATPEACDTDPVGTGPFRFVSSKRGADLVVDRNPTYWQVDAAGRRLPYLDRIVFRPIPDPAARIDGLRRGDIDLTATTDPEAILRLRRSAAARTMDVTEGGVGDDVNFAMLNVSRPPFDNELARVTLAHAVDMNAIIADTQHDLVTRAVQPFSPGSVGYTDPKRIGVLTHDPKLARTLVHRYEQQTGHVLAFQLTVSKDPSSQAAGRLLRAQAEGVGMQVDLTIKDGLALTNDAIAGSFNAVLWRSYPGGDADTQAIWWRSHLRDGGSNAANFGRINDPELDQLLSEGRSETDPAIRARIYAEVSQRFAQHAYSIWGWYTTWAFGSALDVRGLGPVALPSGDQPLSLAGFEPVVGLWKHR